MAAAAEPTERRRMRFSLFEADQPSPEKLAVTPARLRKLVGPEHVGAPTAPYLLVFHIQGSGSMSVIVHAVAWKVEEPLGRQNKPR